jgi:hypothetical protein
MKSKIQNPSRATKEHHAENLQRIREIKAEIRALAAAQQARWQTEKPQALAALRWLRHQPAAERAFFVGNRLRGEPRGCCVLRNVRLWQHFAPAFALPCRGGGTPLTAPKAGKEGRV